MSEPRSIWTAAVLGAGTMGAQIAAHLANAGIPSHLLDLTGDQARDGLKRAASLKPDPFYTRAATALVTTGGFDTDFDALATADWIIEAVVERMDVKRGLLERVDAVRRPGTIVSSNTSGMSISVLGEGRSEDFRRHWLGTHFFNPPRYLRLLEIIPTPDTDPLVVSHLSRFADRRLGKGIVVARDTPNFIANHIGLFGVAETLRVLAAGDYTIEEIDAITGPAIGRPKSATFRTMDLAGLDILAHVAQNLVDRLDDPEARARFVLPPIVGALVGRGSIGDKAGQGFYKRVPPAKGDVAGKAAILTLEQSTLEYRPKQAVRLGALEAARGIEDPGERIRTLFLGKDKVGAFLRATLGQTLLYAARVAPRIASSIDDIDRAMRWGFGWELGPFEIWDAIGIQTVLEATETGASDVPPIVAAALKSGRSSVREGAVPPASADLQILRAAKNRQRVVRRNAGASLVDLGDGVLAVEFHSKKNSIGSDTIQMLQAGLKEAAANFQALVVGNDADDFSAGANLMLLLLEAQEGNWDEIDLVVRAFQQVNLALRYSPVPVIVAPAGLALAGGCEIVLHGDRVQAAAESYIGLVEVGVGLIPAGGGTKEMMARALGGSPEDLLPLMQSVFETIAFAKVSTSAPHARELGYLRDVDGITMNRERLMADAKAAALARVQDGYRPAPRRSAIPVGGEQVLAALKLGVHLAWKAGRITDHDAVIGRALAKVVAGGALPHRAIVSEEYLLDLEREAFLQLCGERKTLERIQHTLTTGKPLRN
jgi:3-hydroxyacyl-CoA dehydrogenase